MTAVSPPRPPLLDVNDVAEWLNLPWRTVQHMAATKQIRAAKLGRQWRFRSEDVEAYVKRQFGEPEHIDAKPTTFRVQQRPSLVTHSRRPNSTLGDGYVPVFGALRGDL